MVLFLWCPLLAAAFQGPSIAPAEALHAVVRSEFHYLGSVRTSESEFWASGDRLWRKRDGKIAPYSRPPTPAPAQGPEDLHTAGFDYDPEFHWQVADTAETREIHGRQCRLTTAGGIAAYSQTNLRLWFCSATRPEETQLSQLVADTAGGPYHGIAGWVAGEARRHTGTVLLALEETTEPAIAPVMVRKIETTALDSAPAVP